MLEEIRSGNPEADITFLIATGFHRPTTKEELIGKFGEKVVAEEKIVVHNAFEPEAMVNIGTMAKLWIFLNIGINRLKQKSFTLTLSLRMPA